MSKAKKTKKKNARNNSKDPARRKRAGGNEKTAEHGPPNDASTLEGDAKIESDSVVDRDDKPAIHEQPQSVASESTAEAKPAISSENSKHKVDENVEAIAGPADQEAHRQWPVDLSKVDVVRERKSAFIVFIDQELRIRWLAAFSPSDLSEECQRAIVRARLVAATPTTYFKEGQQKAWLRMIGESLALALSGDAENSQRTLSMAETFVASRATETARLWYVKASLLAFALFAAIGLSVALIHPLISQINIGETWFKSIGKAILFGAIGAQFSVLLRLSTLNVDPGAGRDAHYVEAVVRILVGVFAAVIAVVAMRADVILGFLIADHVNNPWVIPAIAVLAGVSERFVPSILPIESSTLIHDSKVTGEHLANDPASNWQTGESVDSGG